VIAAGARDEQYYSLAEAERSRLHKFKRLVRDGGELLIKADAVWTAQYLAVIVFEAAARAHRRMWVAIECDSVADTYAGWAQFMFWQTVLVRMARSIGQSVLAAHETLLPVVRDPNLDEERARAMAKAGFKQMRLAHEGTLALVQLFFNDSRVPHRHRDGTAAVLAGLVRARTHGAFTQDLKTALKREGHNVLAVLGAAALQVLVEHRATGEQGGLRGGGLRVLLALRA
jgi:Cft2 family RNA processing exonuclease